MMNCLVVTNLFPNNKDPNRGLFVQQEIRSLSKLCNIKVLAPVPWFPPFKINSRWHCFSSIEPIEKIGELEVYHPRYLVIPKIGRSLYGFFYFLGIYGTIRRIQRKFPIDILYVHYAYPDGFGVALVARIL